MTLPATLVTRSTLHDRLMAGADKRLTMVVGSAGAGKSVLLSSWAAARPPDATFWLSCDSADANPVRFWAGFIEAPRAVSPGFGADAADLLAMDGAMSADITASIANDAAKLPAGSAILVDDFHYAAAAVAGNMTDLIEQWPTGSAQLVLSTRFDPPLRLHRLRMAGELCELRDHDLYFSLDDSRNLLANFGVEVADADLAQLHQRSEGWAAALQLAALSLRGTRDPAQMARALEVRSNAIAEYFVSEVLDRQPPDVAQFMLDISILGDLTAGACAAVTGRQDAGAVLRRIDAAHLFLVALDDERTSFRYHHLIRQLLRAELQARDQAHENALQLRAAEWFESAGDSRRAARYFLAAKQADQALAVLHDRVVPGFLRDPAMPAPLDLTIIDSSLLSDAPDRLLALAVDLLMSGDTAHSGQYLDLLERAQPPIPPESRLAARLATVRSAHRVLIGQAEQAVSEALAARAIARRAQLADDWVATVPVMLLPAYTWLDDLPAVEREAGTALADPALPEPIKRVLVPAARALAWFEAGHLAKAEEFARTADMAARRLRFDQHFFAVDYLCTLAGLALERRDLDEAEQFIEQALSISEHRRPAYEFVALLDRATIWYTRGQLNGALATIDQARLLLGGTASVLLARADELEALIRLTLGDLHAPAELARGLPAVRRALLLGRIALAAGDHQAAREHLQSPSLSDMGPRPALERQLLLAAAAIRRSDPLAASIVADALRSARHEGFLNTVVMVAPQLTSYLIEHSTQAQSDPFMEQLVAAALQVRAMQAGTPQTRRGLIEPLTAAELRVLKLLPTSGYMEIASTLYISRNTVKAHLRSIYRKLGVGSRSEAIERAVVLQFL
jgi:LuxR family maltose regulon positive regulatory protein